MKSLTKKERNRINELYKDACALYLDNTDFDPIDYMDDNNSIEYYKLWNKDCGECLACGEQVDSNGKCLNKETCYLQTLITEQKNKGRKK
ncbi:MAG: hypothetical protein AABY22_18940 [Nanoarchaeota archaeon]